MSKLQIVVGYDFSDASELAVQRAVELAAAWPGWHTLHVVTVLAKDQTYQSAEQMREELLTRMHKRIEARAPGVEVEVFAHTRIGYPADEMLAAARELGADLIIVGSHNRSALGRVFLGSVSEAIVTRAGCTVLVARPKTYKDVELAPIEEVPAEEHQPSRRRAHRYSYNSGIARTRPDEWPI